MKALEAKAPPQCPAVWVLLGYSAGVNGQLTGLAEALGWPYESKQLFFNRFSDLPNLLRGATLIGIDRRRSSRLEPPWPDLVIAGLWRSVAAARWIKKQSGGATRLVHLMHAQAPLRHFDLIITTPQYRLPARANVLHNTAPLNRVVPDRLAAAAAPWAHQLSSLPRPFTALLVGGESASYVLDPATAARLGRAASQRARASGGALLVTTSPRTPSAAADALVAAIDCPAYCHRWRKGDAQNPYHAFLALADRFVVTVDSASLAAEACATGKPVEVFEWPLRASARKGLDGLVRRWGEASERQPCGGRRSLGTRLYERLVYLGLIKPARDFDAYWRAMKARGLVTKLGEAAETLAPPRPLDDMERTVQRVRELFATAGSRART